MNWITAPKAVFVDWGLERKGTAGRQPTHGLKKRNFNCLLSLKLQPDHRTEKSAKNHKYRQKVRYCPEKSKRLAEIAELGQLADDHIQPNLNDW